jgi:hypothetical protein
MRLRLAILHQNADKTPESLKPCTLTVYTRVAGAEDSSVEHFQPISRRHAVDEPTRLPDGDAAAHASRKTTVDKLTARIAKQRMEELPDDSDLRGINGLAYGSLRAGEYISKMQELMLRLLAASLKVDMLRKVLGVGFVRAKGS